MQHDFWTCDTIGTGVGIMWCWHQQCNHWIPEVKTKEMRCNMVFLVMWCHWHHVRMMVSSIVPLNSLGQDDENKVQHEFFDHVMSLASASYNSKGIISDTWHCWHNQYYCLQVKSYNTSKQSFQHEKCNVVIHGTISFMWQEKCYCHIPAKMNMTLKCYI